MIFFTSQTKFYKVLEFRFFMSERTIIFIDAKKQNIMKSLDL